MKKLLKNKEIKAPQVRLIDDGGDQVGVKSLSEALRIAKEKNLDLVEISPQAKPPVCKIMDFGSYLYEQKKKLAQQKKASKAQTIKEIKFGIRISDHDFDVRLKKTRKFLEKGHIVRIILQFKGREASHSEIGYERLKQMTVELEDIGKQEMPPKKQGRSVVTEFRPLPKKGK